MKVCHHTHLYCFFYLFGCLGSNPSVHACEASILLTGPWSPAQPLALSMRQYSVTPHIVTSSCYLLRLCPLWEEFWGHCLPRVHSLEPSFSNGACWTLCRGQDLDVLLPIVRMICSEKCWDWGHLQKPLGSIVGLRGEAVFNANNKSLFSLELKFTFSSIFAQDWE